MKRRIHFFTGEALYHSTSSKGAASHQADLQAILNVIDGLPWDKSLAPNAYDSDNDGHVAVKMVRFGDRRAFGQLARSRSSALPLIDKQGHISPLRLGADESLFEASHFGLFWDYHHCILVLEYNQHAPRHKRLSEYLKAKLFNHPSVLLDEATFKPMVRKSAIERMLQYDELGKLEMTFFRSVLDDLSDSEKDNDLYRAMKANADAAPELGVIQLGIRASIKEKRARQGAKPNWLRVLGRLIGNYGDRFQKAYVEMYPDSGPNLVDINLLSDKWVHEIVVPTLEGRSIDSSAMFTQIEELYDANIQDLLSSAEDV